MKRYLQKQRPEAFYKKVFLKNFTKPTRKRLCRSLFYKRDSDTNVFSVNFAKKFKSTYFIEHLRKAACVSNKITP